MHAVHVHIRVLVCSFGKIIRLIHRGNSHAFYFVEEARRFQNKTIFEHEFAHCRFISKAPKYQNITKKNDFLGAFVLYLGCRSKNRFSEGVERTPSFGFDKSLGIQAEFVSNPLVHRGYTRRKRRRRANVLASPWPIIRT